MNVDTITKMATVSYSYTLNRKTKLKNYFCNIVILNYKLNLYCQYVSVELMFKRILCDVQNWLLVICTCNNHFYAAPFVSGDIIETKVKQHH